MATKQSKTVCSFCSTNASKYTCPRCDHGYCSSECYRSESHGNCAQEFFREWVFNFLQNERVDEETKQKTIDLIRRSAAADGEDMPTNFDCKDLEDLDEDDEGEDLEERFEGIDLENCDLSDEMVGEIMKRLTEVEKKEFEQLVTSGDIVNLIPAHEFWKPWWIDFSPILINDLDSESEKVRSCPEIARNVLKLSDITKNVSPLIQHSVSNVIFSYCYICRYFNGDHHRDAIEAVRELIAICSVLRDPKVTFDDGRAALQDAIQFLITAKSSPIPFITELLTDVHKISSSKSDISSRIISDLIVLVKNAVANKECSKDKKRQFKLMIKKLEFFLAWTNEMSKEGLMVSVMDIELELMSMRGHEKTSKESESFIKAPIEINDKKKVLIEEI